MHNDYELKRRKWYEKRTVKHELLRAMKNREVIFMDRVDHYKCIRGLWVKTIKYLEHIFEIFNFLSRDYNIYVSTATYKNGIFPDFTIDLKKRSKQTSAWFEEEAIKNIIDYDILLDFDTKKLQQYPYMRKEVIQILNILDAELVPYNFFPSGNNYQVIIKGNSLNVNNFFSKSRNNLESFNGYVYFFTKTLKERFNLKHLDLKGVGVFNKIRKCEYSLVQDKVCLPLTKSYFEKWFSYDEVDSNRVQREISLGFRNLKFHNDYGEKENKKHMLNFRKKYFLL